MVSARADEVDPLIGLLVLFGYGVVLSAVAFFFIARERRQKRKRPSEAGHGEAQA